LEELGPGEKRIAKKLALDWIRRLTFCFSVVSTALGFSGLMVVAVA
jgi:hypothetical protein